MSKLNRNKLKKMILQEFKMMGMADMMPMGKIGAFSHGHDDMMDDEPEDISSTPNVEVKIPGSVGEEYYYSTKNQNEQQQSSPTTTTKTSPSDHTSIQQQKSLDEAADPITQRRGRSLLASSNKSFIKDPKALLALILRERLRS